MNKEYTLGNRTFKNKKAAIDFIKSYINPGGVVPNIKPEDYPLFVALLSHHPRAESFTNGYIGIRKDPVYKKYNQLYFHHNDSGLDEEFSYKNCINGYNLNNLRRIWFRTVIKDDITEFRKSNHIPHVCPLCKQQCDIYDVHHAETKFCQLLKQFLTLNNIDMNSLHVNHNVDHRYIIMDDELMKKWQTYHHENAKLQYLCHNCNMKEK